MALLITAIVLLSFSGFFGAYLAEAYTTSFKVAKFAKSTAIILFYVGIIILFLTTNWKIGLAGIGGYWLLFILSRMFWHRRLKESVKS